MEKEIQSFDSIANYCSFFGFTPQHPLVAVVKFDSLTNRRSEYYAKWGLYALFLKKTAGCTINYGRTSYDYDNQSVVCFSPGQLTHTIVHNTDITPEALGLVFHPDLLFRTSLAKSIRQYSFFGYDSREALHLSPEECENIEECFLRIAKELSHPIDKFSKNLLVSGIALLLDYCMRYYSRQFEVREVLNAGIMTKFDDLLHEYLHDISACANGLPNVKYFADRLALSPNYFGDIVKRETGMTAQDYIQNGLLSRAKILLLEQDSNVSQTAYHLGFQYPQHFIRFFKRKTGITPKEFINMN